MNGGVVISPNIKKTSDRIDPAGNIINPRTREVIQPVQQEYVPPVQPVQQAQPIEASSKIDSIISKKIEEIVARKIEEALSKL